MNDDDMRVVRDRFEAYWPGASPDGWLYCQNRLLRNRTPARLIREGQTMLVLKCIDRMDSGRL